LLLVACPAELCAQKAPYDVFPPAEVPYYRVRYEASDQPGDLIYGVNYTVWIPPGVKKLRGVIVHQHGCGEGSCKSGLTGAYDLHWQALAKKHDAAPGPHLRRRRRLLRDGKEAAGDIAHSVELCSFPNGRHDDQVDGSSGAFNKLAAAFVGPLSIGVATGRSRIACADLPSEMLPSVGFSPHGLEVPPEFRMLRQHGFRRPEEAGREGWDWPSGNTTLYSMFRLR
jgi:hypothetical protein